MKRIQLRLRPSAQLRNDADRLADLLADLSPRAIIALSRGLWRLQAVSCPPDLMAVYSRALLKDGDAKRGQIDALFSACVLAYRDKRPKLTREKLK